MGEKLELKPETLLNLDDLLQCPVCYEIPTGQIFQCNEGHHVCGRCKVRLDVCPVCRALFFGTRNYAMEELIANFRKLRAFKSGGKLSAGSGSSSSSTTTKDATSLESENDIVDDNSENVGVDQQLRPPPACKGLFRCLCCKVGKSERLPTARLLNHLRYYHAPELIEGRSENGEYVQAWHFSTVPGRLVTAVRVADMGVFFLVIEISCNSIHAWLTMAASPWVAQVYNYTITLSGIDREAIFNDCVWSVRSCEGTLKKRGHCLIVTGQDAQALITPAALSGKLSVRRTPPDQLANQTQPRAVMRVANRGTENISTENINTLNELEFGGLEPFLQDLQNDVNRLSRAFASLGREAAAFVRLEPQPTQIVEDVGANRTASSDRANEDQSIPPTVEEPIQNAQGDTVRPMSRSTRRRLRQHLRAVMNNGQGMNAQPSTVVEQPEAELIGVITQHGAVNLRTHDNNLRLQSQLGNSQPQLVNSHNTNGTSTGRTASGGNTRNNRRKRRQRR